MKQPLNAGQASSTTTLGPSDDDLPFWENRIYSTSGIKLSKFVLSGKKVSLDFHVIFLLPAL